MPAVAASARPHLLYIAFYYPPTRASGVHRTLATANHFVRAGWDVTVVTVPPEFYRDYIHSYDPSLESAVDGSIRIERVAFPGDWRFEPDLRRYSRLRASFPSVVDKSRNRLEQMRFPESYAPWIRPVVRRVRSVHRRQRVDMVLATGNPHAAFAAAWAVHRRARVPYAVDYRDSWTLDLYADEPAYPPGHRAWRWERRILTRCTHAVFVNEPLRVWHQERYPGVADRMLVVQNGWEPSILAPAQHVHVNPDRPLRFGYLGTLTTRVPLEEFFEGWRLAHQHDVLSDAEIHLYGHLGYFPSNANQVASAIPKDPSLRVSYCGPVAKTDVGTTYEQLDVLLLMLAGSRYVTSGKVYEYIATGKPIVSVHDPDNAATDVLRGYPLWFPCASLSPADISAALVRAAVAARTVRPDDIAAGQRFAEKYTRDAQLAPLQEALRAAVKGGNR